MCDCKEKINQNRVGFRKDELLRVVVRYIRENGLEEYDIHYDGVACDGQCLIDDIISVLAAGNEPGTNG